MTLKTSGGSLLFGAALAATACTQASEKPNIILIMTDQQWAGEMSCAGNPDLHTPAMDKLAEHGVRFTNAYCAFPLSGPSRAAMFTGLFPSQSGVDENEMPLPSSLRDSTLGTLVAAAGYDCVYAGKWHVNTVSIPDGEFGFRNIKDNGDAGIEEACIEYLREKHEKPFFLVASYTNPHNICQVARGQDTPDAVIDYGSPEVWPALPENFEVSADDSQALQFEKTRSLKLYPTVNYTPQQWRRYRWAYARLTEAVDAKIGKIVEEIDRQNLWENTVVIFMSDHGDGNAAHHWNQKTALYEEVTNVPFIVCAPGGKRAGEVSDRLVNSSIDFMPTICEISGAGVPDGRPGKSILAILENDREIHSHIITETNFKQTAGTLGWMVRTSDYKYVRYDRGANPEQLFDMTSDRLEMHNLASEKKYLPVLEEHRKILNDRLGY